MGAARELVLTVRLGDEVERDRGRDWGRELFAEVLAVDLVLDDRELFAGAERALAAGRALEAGRALRAGGAFCSCRVSVLFRCDLAWLERDFLAWTG